MSHSSPPSLLWVVPERDGGIATYSNALFPAVRQEAESRGYRVEAPCVAVGPAELSRVVERVRETSPTVVHIQHEYAFFGRKEWPFNRFPAWLRALRQASPRSRFVATSHTVIPGDFRYALRGSTSHRAARELINTFGLPILRRGWHRANYAGLDAVVVHSELQRQDLQSRIQPRVMTIPHFVLQAPGGGEPISSLPQDARPLVVIFGYIGWEKAQDVAVRAWTQLRGQARLLIAGGVRRPEDRAFAEELRSEIRRNGLESEVLESGYVPETQLNDLYRRADLVLAPFRQTSGSGSITHAFARGAPVLASDLPLNRELNERVPGTISLFRSEDPADLAAQISRLLGDPTARESLRQAGRKYAEFHRPEAIARAHLGLYGSLSQ